MNDRSIEDAKKNTNSLTHLQDTIEEKSIMEIEINNKRDSILQIIEYNKEIKTQLNEFYKTATYQPSSIFDHVNHLRKYSTIGHIDGQSHEPKHFIDYIIKYSLEDSSHIQYLTDRHLLRRLKNKACDNYYVSIMDTLSGGQDISITLNLGQFNSQDHDIKYNDQSSSPIEIDGSYPFGAVYSTNPDGEITEIRKLEIVINGIKLETKLKEYQNLYDPKFCSFGGFKRITEAYQDGENIYIYIFGGVNADSYFAKLIFDINTGYKGKIISDYWPLSQYGSFTEDFIGF